MYYMDEWWVAPCLTNNDAIAKHDQTANSMPNAVEFFRGALNNQHVICETGVKKVYYFANKCEKDGGGPTFSHLQNGI